MKFQQPNNQQNQMQLKTDDQTLKGVYANNMQVAHNKEEFLIDFMNVFPPVATLNARVILSPGHAKRMIIALTENLKRYEEDYGEIQEAPSISNQGIGFKTE